MFVEILDGRPAGQLVDMNPGAAIELINQGRAKRAFSDPSPALPPKPGAYSGTYVATKASPAHIEVVVRPDEPTGAPLTIWDAESDKPTKFTAPAKAKKNR